MRISKTKWLESLIWCRGRKTAQGDNWSLRLDLTDVPHDSRFQRFVGDERPRLPAVFGRRKYPRNEPAGSPAPRQSMELVLLRWQISCVGKKSSPSRSLFLGVFLCRFGLFLAGSGWSHWRKGWQDSDQRQEDEDGKQQVEQGPLPVQVDSHWTDIGPALGTSSVAML